MEQGLRRSASVGEIVAKFEGLQRRVPRGSLLLRACTSGHPLGPSFARWWRCCQPAGACTKLCSDSEAGMPVSRPSSCSISRLPGLPLPLCSSQRTLAALPEQTLLTGPLSHDCGNDDAVLDAVAASDPALPALTGGGDGASKLAFRASHCQDPSLDSVNVHIHSGEQLVDERYFTMYTNDESVPESRSSSILQQEYDAITVLAAARLLFDTSLVDASISCDSGKNDLTPDTSGLFPTPRFERGVLHEHHEELNSDAETEYIEAREHRQHGGRRTLRTCPPPSSCSESEFVALAIEVEALLADALPVRQRLGILRKGSQ